MNFIKKYKKRLLGYLISFVIIGVPLIIISSSNNYRIYDTSIITILFYIFLLYTISIVIDSFFKFIRRRIKGNIK